MCSHGQVDLKESRVRRQSVGEFRAPRQCRRDSHSPVDRFGKCRFRSKTGQVIRSKSEHRFDRRVGDGVVVHEKPIAPAKRVAIGLLHRCSGSDPHMRQEQWVADLAGVLE